MFFQVMEKLKILFTGYAEYPPTCFVMCGNFLSDPAGGKRNRRLKGNCIFYCDKGLTWLSMIKILTLLKN